MSIFTQYAYNSSYKDIAKALDVKPKTVDNALMRIRKKSAESYQIYLTSFSQINIGIASYINLHEGEIIQEFIGISTFTML